jgi:hypothetical protein
VTTGLRSAARKALFIGAGALVGIVMTAGAASADQPMWTVSPMYPNAGDTVSVTLSGNDANPSNQLDIYYETPGQTQCAMLRPDEAARPTARLFVHQTFGSGPYSGSGQFQTGQQGDYLLCAYIYTPANPMQPEHIQTSVGYEPLTVYPQKSGPPPPPTGPQTTFHLVNKRGTAQFGAAVREGDNSTVTIDGSGTVTLSVQPGEVLRFTRDPEPPTSLCSPPEGNGIGMHYTVPNPPAAQATIIVPNATGPSFHPELSSAESWVIGRINQLRAAHGASPLTISKTLDRAADASAHDAAQLKARTGRYPWPPAHCDVIAQDWGWPSNSGIGAEDAPTTSAAAALAHWTDSSARGRTTLDPKNTAVGIGDGSGAWVMEIGSCPSGPYASRCELTTNTGDPNASHGNTGHGNARHGHAGHGTQAHRRAVALAHCRSLKDQAQRTSCARRAGKLP